MKHLGKRLLAAGLTAAMVIGSVGVVSAEDSTSSTVTGTADDVTISTAFGASTGSVTLSGDFELTYSFTNKSNGTSDDYNSWYNFIVEMNNSNGVYVDVRADNYGWVNGSSEYAVGAGEGLTDWTTWNTAMQSDEGVEFAVTVKRTGAYVVVTTSSDYGKFYEAAYVSEYEDGCDLTVKLTGQTCTISNVSYSYVSNEEAVDYNLVKETSDLNADDVTISTAFGASTGSVTLSGDFELTYSFTNKSNGTSDDYNSWYNFIVEMNNSNGVYVDVRADNYGWVNGSSEYAVGAGEGLADWTTWNTAMQSDEGVEFTVTVKRTGAYVVVTTSSDYGTFYETAYVSEYEDGCDLTVKLTGQTCAISNVSYSYTTLESGTTDEYITYLGGSLRMDYEDYNQASLRFGYTITVPENADITSWSWDWWVDGVQQTAVTGVNKVANTDGTYTSNLVVTGIPSTDYDVNIDAQLTVTYTLEDGTTCTVTEATSQERSVSDVANAIVAEGSSASSEEVTYANGILSAMSN